MGGGGGKSTVKSSETEFTAPRKHIMPPVCKFSRMSPREQRKRESERQKETETERVDVYVLVFRGDRSPSLI